MLILDKRKYERIVSDLIDAKDVRDVVDKFSIDRIYYYHILKDISSGQRSPNFKYLKSIARKRKLSQDFVVEQSKLVLNYFIPYYQSYQSDSLDYYKLLNVSRNATEEEIRRSWIELMKSHHPDKAGAEGLDVAKKINEAYEVLSNSAKRESYDNKHLPATPVIIPENALAKYYYAVPIVLAIFLVIMYASGSGLLFKSQEEKERFAKEIEDPSLPNAVYKGDMMKDKPRDSEISRIKPIEPGSDTKGVTAKNENEPVEAPSNQAMSADRKPAAVNDIAGKNKEIGLGEPEKKESPELTAKVPETRETETNELAASEIRETKPQSGEPEKKIETAQISPGEAEKTASAGEKSDVSEKKVAAEARMDESESARKKEEVTDKAVSEDKPSMQAKEPEPVNNAVIAEKPRESTKPVSETAPSQAIAKAETPPGATYHTVKKGESLWSIAHKYDTTTAEITKLNNIENGNIKIGDKLLISGNGVPLHEAETVRLAAGNRPTPPEPSRVASIKKPEIAKTVVTKAETVEKSPQKSDITADFNPGLATSAVSIRNTEVVAPQPVPRVRPPDTQSLYTFVTSYVSAYRNKDIGRVKALFAPDAKENGVNISKVMNSYSSNFSKLDIVRYDVTVNKATLDTPSGYVTGDFFITFKDQRTGVLKNSRGSINWKLSWADGGWKIQELTYKIISTNSYGG